MKIEIGKIYENKTWKFLIPTLNGHGREFIQRFNVVYKLAVGIGDMNLQNTPIAGRKAIYAMLDKFQKPKYTETFLAWLKYQPYYITDYCPDTYLEIARKHMIVIEIPKMFHDTYDKFLKGKYSEMYKRKDVDNMKFLTPETYNVLIGNKSKEALEVYKAECKAEFGVVPTEVKELRLPPKKTEEVFNYDDKQIFF